MRIISHTSSRVCRVVCLVLLLVVVVLCTCVTGNTTALLLSYMTSRAVYHHDGDSVLYDVRVCRVVCLLVLLVVLVVVHYTHMCRM